jgi:GMP synthase (glutamine-hydrolysing)
MIAERPILIVKTGSTLPEIAARRGDFEDWIGNALGANAPLTDVLSVFDEREIAFPEPNSLAGVVVTGSSAMVSHAEPWSERTAEWLRSIVELETPCLGICYGHQLLAKAMGGQVGPNPRGREIGTVTVDFADAHNDPLLGFLGSQARVQTSHVESVLERPPGAIGLGSTPLDPHHVFSVGGCAWGVQFHPEFDADVMRGYIRGRREALVEESLDPDALLESVEEAATARRLIARFGDLCRAREAGSKRG